MRYNVLRVWVQIDVSAWQEKMQCRKNPIIYFSCQLDLKGYTPREAQQIENFELYLWVGGMCLESPFYLLI